ncbi:MAG TPA: thiopeptide-type bacteriocin biosynthesis protein, partial [Ktedonobacteraceae bacterium]
MTWQSIHIFYQKGQDDFLVHCIEPLAESLKNDKLITQLFFLRYWKQGPHIRLRFFVPDSQYNDQVKDMICDQVTSYLKQHPSSGEINDELYKEAQERFGMLEQEEVSGFEMVPDNTWRVEQYKPEYTK